MFHLHYDTDLDRLADTLGALLARRDGAYLLAPQTVLVPQAGVQRWLVQRLAERHGIAANLEFLAPAQLTWRLLRAAHPELPAQSAFDRETLRWRLLGLFDVQAADDPKLAALIEAEPATLRRFELAGHLAQLFERYQAYRRDLLERWQAGADPDDSQARLWRALLATSGEAPRSALLADFLRRYGSDDGAPTPGLPARLLVFGCINISPDVLRLLGVLGRHCELHFFMPTPCREYWGDLPNRRDWRAQLAIHGGGAFDQPANPLLLSMGGAGRDFVAQVFGYDEVQPDSETGADDAEPPRNSLLQRVQADVITLKAPEPANAQDVPDIDDVSLQIHRCHSPLREVQVLHDQLLDLFQRHPQWEPRDIAVMLPDIARYAPCVDAVFGAIGSDDPRFIPWTVADRPPSEAHAISALFDHLLDLPTARLTLDEVLQIIAEPAVLAGCGLDGADVQRLHDWAVGAGIRWGEDEHDREAHGLPPYREFSWRFGRERLLLGYLLGDDDEGGDGGLRHGIAPLTDIEGQRVAALGQLLRVQKLLRRLRAAQRQPRAPLQWQRLLNDAVSALIDEESVDADAQRALAELRATLAALAESAEAGGYEQPLDWMSVRSFLRERLGETGGAQRFLAGGVSVCGMVPLRNVPFRVICVLGLDAQSFPRHDPADALDRLYRDALEGKRRPGDRALRDDDRYLFLQTLMAARDVLYLSYTGIELRDGSVREPSVVLSELLDVLSQQYFTKPESARKALVVRHPMQPFAPVLFEAREPQLFTYRAEWQAAAAAPQARSDRAPFVDANWPGEPASSIELDDLVRFVRAPQREFMRRQLGAALEADALDTPEREPLTEDPRRRAELDRHLLKLLLRDPPAEGDECLAQLRAQGLLAPLALGDQELAEALRDVAPQARAWRRWRGDATPLPGARFELALPSGRLLEGVLAGLEPAGYAGWVGRANSARRWGDWWLGALVARALHGDIECVAFGREEDGLTLPLAPAMPSADDARCLLDALLTVREQGMGAPLLLPPRSGWCFVMHVVRGKPEPYALAKAEDVWGGAWQFSGESADPWIATALRGASPFDEANRSAQFMHLASAVYGPLWAALHDGTLA